MVSSRVSAARRVLVSLACGSLLVPGAWAQTVTAPTDGFARGFAHAPGLFPGVWHPYIEQTVEAPSLDAWSTAAALAAAISGFCA